MPSVTIDSGTIGGTQPNAPTGLTATTAFDGVQLDWVNPTNAPIDYIQIASSTVNNVAAGFTTVANVKTTAFYDHSTTAGNVYYWVRAVSTLGNIGPWNAANTAGTLGTPQEVTITSAAKGDMLVYDSTKWVNSKEVAQGISGNAAPTFTRETTSTTLRSALRVRKTLTAGSRTDGDGPNLVWSYTDSTAGYDYGGMRFRYDTGGAHDLILFTSTDASNAFGSATTLATIGPDTTTFNANITSTDSISAPGTLGYSSFITSGANQKGGSGYHGFLEVTNTAASNPNKFFRLNSTGAIEIVNSGYTAVILTLDNGGNLLVPGSVRISSSTSAIGYAAGSGSTVTQSTSKTTAVTINTPTGEITMNNSSLAAGFGNIFTVNNSTITSQDNVVVNVKAGAANYAAYGVFASNIQNGSFAITLRNFSAGALAEAVVVSYSIIKGSTA